MNSLYKLISKVLANRLKRVVSCLVNKAQIAFIEGRQILDASLIANEIIDSMIKEKEKGILCKLDIEKAYDQISWNFLFTVLQQMGFGIKWISWIKWCITTASFSVLVNGSPTGFFRSSRGLIQGDPLSPYLFVLGIEVFSILVEKASARGFLSGHKFVGKSEETLQISYLLFVDDTLVFCKDSEDHLSSLCWILLWFEVFSGLRINLEKSVIMPVGPVENVDQLVLKFGCKVGALPTTYLGLPLGCWQASISVWDRVEEKFWRKLAMWKRRHISKEGRLTLIRSTLSNLPIYLMSLLRMPRGVSSRLEKIQRDFLWGSNASERKIHLINWKQVCLSKAKGGLGIRSLLLMNKALLSKWA